MSRPTILDIAAAENGTKESPPNSNKTRYGQWYGLNGEKWCAIFVSFVYHHAGHHMDAIDTSNGYQSCQSGFNFWKRKNRLTKDPQPGDVVLFDWTGDGHSDHTGIFVKWLDDGKTKFQAWEGNTAQGNDSDGGQVMLRERSRTTVAAFATPLVLDEFGAPNFSDNSENLQRGDMRSAVTVLQKLLHDLDFKITVDGDFGPGTEAAVKDFQQKHSLPVTGVVTPEVLGVIQEEAAMPSVAVKKFTSGAFIKKGSSGSVVLSIQQALNANGADPKIDENGVFDNDTLTAVKAFQQKNSLGVDGIVGPKTFHALGITSF
jgi:peptidoglycan hydrolase-like protein with peptidoglycan-binding domain